MVWVYQFSCWGKVRSSQPIGTTSGGLLKQVAVSNQGPKNRVDRREKRWENVRCKKKNEATNAIQIDGSKSDDYSVSNNGENDQRYEKQNGKKDNDNDNVREKRKQ